MRCCALFNVKELFKDTYLIIFIILLLLQYTIMIPMAALPESQPDTQPVTQTLDESSTCSSSEDTYSAPHYWGRLYPATRGVLVCDLTEKETIVGKTSSCNIVISEDEVNLSIWNVISKKHFKISRTVSSSDPLLNIKIELTDLSLNGTFVNGVKVSKGKTVQLYNDDIIAVAKAEFKLYVFMESHQPNNEHTIIHKHFAVSRRLGMGSYGEVKLIFSKETGVGYAMKIIKKTNFVNVDRKMEIEIKILQKINHPNVIKLVQDYESPSNRYLILQYMEGGDLCERITKSKFLQESQAKLYFSQLVSGMIYLHDKGIVHRDLKPENILLASNDVNTVVKITDFGLSKILETGCIMQTLCGTKLYVAPEVIKDSNKPYTGMVDVWSLGVILFVCLSGTTPFVPTDEKSIEDQIKEGKFHFQHSRWPHVSKDAKALIRKMMNRDPEKRISMALIKKCAWLRDKVIDTRVEELVEALSEIEMEVQVNKENKRLLNSSSEELVLPSKRARMEKMDFL